MTAEGLKEQKAAASTPYTGLYHQGKMQQAEGGLSSGNVGNVSYISYVKAEIGSELLSD